MWIRVSIAVVVVVGAVVAYWLIPPSAAPEGKASVSLYQPGGHGLVEESIELEDTNRPTAANGEYGGADSRQLAGSLWYPQDQVGAPYPLVVYSHGFMSSAEEARFYAEFLAPKGYVVVAVNYPLSNGQAPGGPNARDVRNQPADVSFVIDNMLARNVDTSDPLFEQIDPDRIALAGLSLGGLTTILTGFHERWRDPRVKAVAAIAGPTAFFDETFFDSSDVPFLMIAGSDDKIITYDYNAARVPMVDDNATLVTLDRGTHVGFAALAAGMFRWSDHPDETICPMLVQNLDRKDNPDGPMFEPDPAIGVIEADPGSAPCLAEEFERSMRPAQQLMLTRLALFSFLQGVLSADVDEREEMRTYLTYTYAAENPDVSVTVSGG